MPPTPAPGRSPAPAATAALRILRVLAAHPQPVPAATVAREVGLPRATAYKLLRVLQDEGFVTHLPEDQRYGLGVGAIEIGTAFSRQAGLGRLSRPLLAKVVDDTRHNAHLAVLHGRDVLYVLEERAPRRPVLVSDVGVRLPAHLTASGLALLAGLPSAQVRALYPDRDAFVQRHAAGPATLGALRTVLSEVRRRGFAVEEGTVSPGMASVACAAVDHNGLPVAAVAITYPADAVEPTERDRLVAAARATAAELTRRVRGVRTPPPVTGK